MRARLMAAGVPDAAILTEPHARDTEENARLSAPLIRGTGAARVTLVTDPWHMARARLCFALHGIGTRPAPTSPSPAPPAKRILRRVREALATPRSAVLTMLRRGGPRG